MRIVFSRKGVDSAAGRCASALVEGRAVSLPIPTSMPSATRYSDLAAPIPSIASDVSSGRLSADRFCHLDPDIDRSALAVPRPKGWRGALGQVSAALSHLQNCGVGPDDVFLFWGLFRACEYRSTGWRYAGPRQHLIFGWLQVEEVISLGADGSHILKKYPWLRDHPHVRAGWASGNTIYVARRKLSFVDTEIAGYGVFDRPIVLTADGSGTASTWSVPRWLDPSSGGVGMTYHPPERWLGSGLVKAAARGQEFVAYVGDREDARHWLKSLFERS